MDVVVSAKTDSTVRACADTLAAYLEKISGASFKVVAGDGERGIAVAKAGDFPNAPCPLDTELIHHEDYILRTHPGGVWIAGATGLATENAVWDFLYRLGYRRFFPGKNWEIIPSLPHLSLALDVSEHPSFYDRAIWYGWGAWQENGNLAREWAARNRMGASVGLSTGHAYGAIYSRFKISFEMHPEYLALVSGKRVSDKFCLSNPNVRRLMVEYAVEYFRNNPKARSISMEPSDGNGWCECDKCKALGSITDRAVGIANEVADTVTRLFGEKFVGMYAYNQHSPPPTIRVNPHVVISVATAFIKGGFTVNQLLSGWKQKCAVLGIRDYLSVNVWDRDLPNNARAAFPDNLAANIDTFYNYGARFYTSEAGENWGPYGLGYYLSSRWLWNVDDISRKDELAEDFFDKSFGTAKGTMKNFYSLLENQNHPPVTDSLLFWMYSTLNRARGESGDAGTRARIDDLILYTRYVQLFCRYSYASGRLQKQKAFESVLSYALRIRNACMIHSYGLYCDLPMRDRADTLAPAERRNSSIYPWMRQPAFTKEQVDSLLALGLSGKEKLKG